MKKWNEITYETFVDNVVYEIIRGVDWMEGKILEIQDPIDPEQKVYIGKINPDEFLREDTDYIEVFLGILKAGLYKVLWGDDETWENCIRRIKTHASILLLERIPEYSRLNPTFIPLLEEGQFDNFLKYIFGNAENNTIPRTKWYLKGENGERYLDLSKDAYKNYGSKDKYIRIRLWEEDEWYENIFGYLKEGKDLKGSEEDLRLKEK